jgi:hypothetical protein
VEAAAKLEWKTTYSKRPTVACLSSKRPERGGTERPLKTCIRGLEFWILRHSPEPPRRRASALAGRTIKVAGGR